VRARKVVDGFLMAFSSCAIVGASVVTDSMSSTLCFSYIHRIQYTHITSSEPKIVRRKDEVKVRHDFERKEIKKVVSYPKLKLKLKHHSSISPRTFL
jgi:hypothetical protein